MDGLLALGVVAELAEVECDTGFIPDRFGATWWSKDSRYPPPSTAAWHVAPLAGPARDSCSENEIEAGRLASVCALASAASGDGETRSVATPE